MEITKREIIASISILAIMLIIGFYISGKISEHHQDENSIYNKAMKIKQQDIFEYSMKTNVGNAFVEGELIALNPVTYDKLKGEYLYIKRVKERYTMHTRVIKSGKSTRVQTYWTWDYIGKEDKISDRLSFLGVNFNSDKFNIPDGDYIDTISDGFRLRSKYYGYPIKSNVTIFGSLKDNTIKDQANVYESNINDTIENLQNSGVFELSIFWLVWIGVAITIIFLFYKAENKWLE